MQGPKLGHSGLKGVRVWGLALAVWGLGLKCLGLGGLGFRLGLEV